MKIDQLASELRSELLSKGHMPVHVRKKKLELLRQAILKNETRINQALKSDLGKSEFETYATETGFIIDEIGHILKHIDGWAKPRKVKTPITLIPGKSRIYYEPYGVVLIISPWNYPFQLCLSPLLGAIAAGNKVVVKPSEFAAETSKVVSDLLKEVFTENEVVVVEGAVEETQSLLKQRFDYIIFTGSTAIGKIVMKSAAEYLTPVTLELGGKSPLLIEESADLDLAAKRCAWGKFLNAGQTCVAPDYVLVPRKKQDEFISHIKKYLEKFYGHSVQTSHDYPRIINQRHFDRLNALIDPSKIAISGDSDRSQRYFPPTVLKNVDWKDKVMEDEIFGPVLPVLPYDNIDDAVKHIRALPKPLAFYVFTSNDKMKNEILDAVPFGGGCVNDTVVHLANPNLPFGGVGPSGMGSYHGRKTFETFSHHKSVYEQNTLVDIPLRYPPYEGKLSWLKLFIR
jgi:aldehyde dehydrogenase (NAD+)